MPAGHLARIVTESLREEHNVTRDWATNENMTPMLINMTNTPEFTNDYVTNGLSSTKADTNDNDSGSSLTLLMRHFTLTNSNKVISTLRDTFTEITGDTSMETEMYTFPASVNVKEKTSNVTKDEFMKTDTFSVKTVTYGSDSEMLYKAITNGNPPTSSSKVMSKELTSESFENTSKSILRIAQINHRSIQQEYVTEVTIKRKGTFSSTGTSTELKMNSSMQSLHIKDIERVERQT